MRKHIILFFSALFSLISCKDSKAPADIIKKDRMIKLLSDVHLVDGSLVDQAGKDSLYKYGTIRYNLVFKKHNIDSASFNRSMKYYAGRADEITEILDSVKNILTRKNDSLKIEQGKFANSKVQPQTVAPDAKSDTTDKQRELDKSDSIKRAEIIKLNSRKRINKNALPK